MNTDKALITTFIPEQFEQFKNFLEDKFLLANFPMIEIKYFSLDEPKKQLLEKIIEFNWLIFTSKRGVRGFFNLIGESGIHVDRTRFPKIACIGEATQDELEKFGYLTCYTNPGNTSQEFGNHLLNGILNSEDKVLLALGERADNELTERLQKHCRADRINVYRTNNVSHVDINLFEMISRDEYEMIVFTSPSAFENFIRLGSYNAGQVKLRIASIGQKTTSFIEKNGFQVSVTAKKSGLENLAKEISDFLHVHNE